MNVQSGFGKIFSFLAIFALVLSVTVATIIAKEKTALQSEAYSLPQKLNSGKIVYNTSSNNGNIFLATTQGAVPITSVQLTKGKINVNPNFTGDGKKILFVSDRDNDPEIYSMNLDGSQQTRLTYSDTGTNDYPASLSPKSSPDGKKVVYESNKDKPDSIFDIYIADFNGSKLTNTKRLTTSSWNDTAIAPVFTNDGKNVIYYKRSDSSLHKIGMNGQNDRVIVRVNGELDQGGLSVSKNGKWLVYAIREPSDARPKIQLMNVDGTGKKNLTSPKEMSYFPAFTPDDEQITYTKDGKLTQIWIMNRDGSFKRPLITKELHVGISSGNPWIKDPVVTKLR